LALARKQTTNAGKKVGRKKTPSFTLLVGMWDSATTMETRMELPQKTKNWLPHTFLGIYPKERESICKKDTWAPIFITTLFTITKLRNHHLTIDEQIKKIIIYIIYYICTYIMEYYLTIKNKIMS
jgi:hypothetical protein